MDWQVKFADDIVDEDELSDETLFYHIDAFVTKMEEEAAAEVAAEEEDPALEWASPTLPNMQVFVEPAEEADPILPTTDETPTKRARRLRKKTRLV